MFSIRRVQHFPGFTFVSRKLLYFEAQESVVLRFQLVCIAVRSIPQLKAALPCRNCVPCPISLQLNYVHPHRLFMAVCSFFTHSMCQMSHSERQIMLIYRMILWQIAHFMQQAAISAKMCCFAALKSVHFCTNPPKKHISSLRFFHITTLCNYHSPVKNAHCTFYRLANDTFSHSVC